MIENKERDFTELATKHVFCLHPYTAYTSAYTGPCGGSFCMKIWILLLVVEEGGQPNNFLAEDLEFVELNFLVAGRVGKTVRFASDVIVVQGRSALVTQDIPR